MPPHRRYRPRRPGTELGLVLLLFLIAFSGKTSGFWNSRSPCSRHSCSFSLASIPSSYGLNYFGAEHLPTDTNVIFHSNALEIGMIDLENFGLRRPLVISGWNAARLSPLMYELEPRGFKIEVFQVCLEPNFHTIMEGVQRGLEHGADCVIAMGGGSVLDAGKLVALLIYSNRSPAEALSTIISTAHIPQDLIEFPKGGNASELGCVPVPLITIPINPGSGSEVNTVAMLHSSAKGKSHIGIPGRGVQITPPFLCLAQPDLSKRLPVGYTWMGAFASLISLMESFLVPRGFIVDMLCLQNIQKLAALLESCPRDFDPKDFLQSGHRESLLMASIITGVVQHAKAPPSVTSLGAATLGSLYGVPHTTGLAALGPAVLAVGLGRAELPGREGDRLLALRADDLAARLLRREGAAGWEAAEWLRARAGEKGARGLAGPFRLGPGDADAVAEAWWASLEPWRPQPAGEEGGARGGGQEGGSVSSVTGLLEKEDLRAAFLQALRYRAEEAEDFESIMAAD